MCLVVLISISIHRLASLLCWLLWMNRVMYIALGHLLVPTHHLKQLDYGNDSLYNQPNVSQNCAMAWLWCNENHFTHHQCGNVLNSHPWAGLVRGYSLLLSCSIHYFGVVQKRSCCQCIFSRMFNPKEDFSLEPINLIAQNMIWLNHHCGMIWFFHKLVESWAAIWFFDVVSCHIISVTWSSLTMEWCFLSPLCGLQEIQMSPGECWFGQELINLSRQLLFFMMEHGFHHTAYWMQLLL